MLKKRLLLPLLLVLSAGFINLEAMKRGKEEKSKSEPQGKRLKLVSVEDLCGLCGEELDPKKKNIVPLCMGEEIHSFHRNCALERIAKSSGAVTCPSCEKAVAPELLKLLRGSSTSRTHSSFDEESKVLPIHRPSLKSLQSLSKPEWEQQLPLNLPALVEWEKQTTKEQIGKIQEDRRRAEYDYMSSLSDAREGSYERDQEDERFERDAAIFRRRALEEEMALKMQEIEKNRLKLIEEGKRQSEALQSIHSKKDPKWSEERGKSKEYFAKLMEESRERAQMKKWKEDLDKSEETRKRDQLLNEVQSLRRELSQERLMNRGLASVRRF